jgi:hypothetical protein
MGVSAYDRCRAQNLTVSLLGGGGGGLKGAHRRQPRAPCWLWWPGDEVQWQRRFVLDVKQVQSAEEAS